jgi:Tfp pilus assembly protein PilN
LWRHYCALWLAAAALSLLFVLLFALFDALLADVGRLQTAVVLAQVSRISPVSMEEIAALRATAHDLAATEELLQDTLARSGQGGIPWLAVLQRIAPVPPSEVQLSGLTQHGDTIIVRGTAAEGPALAAYVARLRGSLLFTGVQIESAAPSFAISLRVKGYEP